MFAKVRVHVGWGRYMGRAGACDMYVGETKSFGWGQYEGKKPLLGRHTHLQDNMKTGLKYMRCDSVDWTKLAQHGKKYDSTSMIQ